MSILRNVDSHAAPGVFLYCERSKDAAKLFAALAKALGEIEDPKRNRTGQYGEYADLTSLRRATRYPLASNGLLVMQTFHMAGQELVLNTTLGHVSGEYVSSQVPIRQAQNPQHTMAYATYMRRMAYAAILNLSADDDDDGETAADAAASTQSHSLLQRALKSIATAESQEQLDALLLRASEKEKTGELPAGSFPEIRKAAVQRQAALPKKAKPVSQETGK